MENYNDRLQDTLKLIYEVKDIKNKDEFNRRVSNFIMSKLNRELLMSSKNIMDLFIKIIDFDKPGFLDELREQEWYEEWFLEGGSEYVNLSLVDILAMKPFELKEFCANYRKYNIAKKIVKGKFDLHNLLYDKELFKLGVYNLVINNGFFKHKEYKTENLFSDDMFNDGVCRLMALLNDDNFEFYRFKIDIDLDCV